MKTKKLSLKSLSFISLVFLIALAIEVSAAPLRFYPITITQPDKQNIKCFVSGDEYYHWIHDENDYTIIKSETDSWYYYAEIEHDSLVPSIYKVGEVNPLKTNLKPGIRLSPSKILEMRSFMGGGLKSAKTEAVATKGRLNNIAVFVRFSDETEFGDSISVYERMFNDSSATSISLYAYYKECSYGQLFIKTHMYPKAVNGMVVSYQDIKPRGYYMRKTNENPDGFTGDGTPRLAELSYRALKFIQEEASNDSELDNYNDGRVDIVNFVIRGKNDTEWGSILWGTPYDYIVTATTPIIKINDKTVNKCIKVMQNSINTGGSVLHHEVFHILGAPDLYHYSMDNFFPIGLWDLMENNNNPAQSMSAYMKYRYTGWINSIPSITKSGRYSLAPLKSSTNNCYRIDSPNSTNFYFVLEYRKRVGAFESHLPGDGLLVYRVNKSRSGQGNANATNLTDELYVYRPGGATKSNGVITSAFLNKKNGRELINDNTPTSCFLPGDLSGGLDISDIKEEGDSITFYVRFEKTPKANFEVSTGYSNNGKAHFYDNSSQSPDSWRWDFGDGQSSSERDPIHYYMDNDTFDVRLIVKNQYGSDTITKKDQIIINRLQQSTENESVASFCNSATTTLKASSSGEGSIVWYNDPYSGQPLGNGETYSISDLDSTEIFYSSLERPMNTSYYVGAKDTTIGTCGTYSSWAFDDLYFDCFCDVILKSVKVFSIADNERRIQIINQKNEIIFDSLVNIPIGEYRIILNAPVEAGRNYKIIVISASPDLYYNTTGAAYPYEIPGIVSLTGNFYGTKEYGFFYDCEFQQANSTSPRTPVTVEVTKAKITHSSSLNICKGSSIELTSSPATRYLWSPGGQTTQSITVADPGSYTVSTLIGDCENTSLPVKIAFKAETPLIPVTYKIYSKYVSFKTDVVKGFHYVFDFGDSKSKIYDPDPAAAKDTFPLSFGHTYAAVGEYKFWQIVTGECGTDSTLYIVDLITSVENIAQESTFTVYPNPATNKISIETHGNLLGETTICIFNMNGAILQLEKFQSQNLIEMEVSAMAKGIYLLKIQNKAGVETKKLVVQ